MEFQFCFVNRELIHEAVKKGNVEILKLLLTAKDIDVNKKAIFINIFHSVSKLFY